MINLDDYAAREREGLTTSERAVNRHELRPLTKPSFRRSSRVTSPVGLGLACTNKNLLAQRSPLSQPAFSVRPSPDPVPVDQRSVSTEPCPEPDLAISAPAPMFGRCISEDCRRVYSPFNLGDPPPSPPRTMALSEDNSDAGKMGEPGGEAIFLPAARSDASLSDLAITASKSALHGIRPSSGA